MSSPNRTPSLVTNPKQIEKNHRAYTEGVDNLEGEALQALVRTIVHVNSWIAITEPDGKMTFAFSKFCGQNFESVEDYFERRANDDLFGGRETERALKPWLRELTRSDPLYRDAHVQLRELFERFGVRPKAACRVSVLRVDDDLIEAPSPVDRDELVARLLVEMAGTLSAEWQKDVGRRITRLAASLESSSW
jgi:hypothetical protein